MVGLSRPELLVVLECRWRLVEIDADLSNLSSETKHVMSLIHPANTYMVLLLDSSYSIFLLICEGCNYHHAEIIHFPICEHT